MNVVYTGRHSAPSSVEDELGARFLALEDLLREADVVSLHCPLTQETRHLINADRLQLMKTSSYLVNTTRGAVVDESALVAALQTGGIAGVGLDVYEHEPHLHPDLFDLENVVLLPHLGSATIETRTAMGLLAAENVSAVLAGGTPPTQVSWPL